MPSTLGHCPAEIVQALLIQLGVGSSPEESPLAAWPVYINKEPDFPDNCITVYDTQGVGYGRLMTDGTDQQYYGFQVRIRSKTKPVGYIKADEIRTALSKSVVNVGVTVETRTYCVYSIANFGSILSLGAESPQSQRQLHTLNALLVV